VKIESHHRGISNLARMPSLNVQKTDICNYISTDLLFVPLIRQMFDLEKFCPIAKVNLFLVLKSYFIFT